MEGVKLLLKHGADIMDTDERENTCMRLAAEYNHPEMVKTLLKHLKKMRDDTLIDMPDNMGFTPLHVAAQKGHTDIVKVQCTMNVVMQAHGCTVVACTVYCTACM